jgi:hypothetical protein
MLTISTRQLVRQHAQQRRCSSASLHCHIEIGSDVAVRKRLESSFEPGAIMPRVGQRAPQRIATTRTEGLCISR